MALPRGRALLRAALALALLHCASAAGIIQHDNSPTCRSYAPACAAKCAGQEYFYICAVGNGPMGTPYVVCRCAAPAMPLGPQQQVAHLVLDPEMGWPGSRACNSKTWANECTMQMTAHVNGTSVQLIPSVRKAFNEDCAPAPGLVLGPKGASAAVVFPQYPIGITSTAPDGTVTIDFSQTAADDPNGHDWTRCILTYRVVKGSFLDPRGAAAAQAQMQQQPALAGPAGPGKAAPVAGDAPMARQLAAQEAPAPAAAAVPAAPSSASAAARPAAGAGAALFAGALAALAAAML
ncbi:hypothetical protein Rsub_01206 [Raphidocelis subcapitata]|uniref:Uncharacterized protein n=1 Tax=Raphidocelis subcapitata TaxID=307507 RepID=A0A2V0NSI3_9CHLO|nr:hypothetical protein Rsub_01206 [Raphidocelis subcapitata]|eukprot:GBF88493.1 hypothetical protein Rsub_01206 [Raphidocelis subcapitata]